MAAYIRVQGQLVQVCYAHAIREKWVKVWAPEDIGESFDRTTSMDKLAHYVRDFLNQGYKPVIFCGPVPHQGKLVTYEMLEQAINECLDRADRKITKLRDWGYAGPGWQEV